MWRAIVLLLMACGGRPTLEVARPPSFSAPPVSSLELARSARRSGDLEAARAQYRAALADGAGCEVALELAALLDDDGARELLAPFAPEAPLANSTLEDLEPTPTCRGAALRSAELTRGAPDDAPVRLLAPLLAADPDDADARAALALHHLARGQLGAASLVCARIDEAHAGAAYACGLVAAEAGELHVAEGRLRASIAADPEGAARGPLAELLFRMRRYDEALALYHREHLRAPDDYGVLVGLAATLVVQRCVSAGRDAYRRATELEPERPEAWYGLGMLYQWTHGSQEMDVESWEALERFVELARDRPELAALVHAVRDDDCLERRHRARRGWSHDACGHSVRLFSWNRSVRGMQQQLMLQMASAGPSRGLDCRPYEVAR